MKMLFILFLFVSSINCLSQSFVTVEPMTFRFGLTQNLNIGNFCFNFGASRLSKKDNHLKMIHSTLSIGTGFEFYEGSKVIFGYQENYLKNYPNHYAKIKYSSLFIGTIMQFSDYIYVISRTDILNKRTEIGVGIKLSSVPNL